MLFNSDLKDVQRPWTFKAIASRVSSGSRLLEIGGGVPLVAGALADRGYKPLIVDPYEGAGNGPTEYQAFLKQYPKVGFLRDLFSPDLPQLEPLSFDCIYSISTLEHIHDQRLIFAAIDRFLKPGGWSIHCIDTVLQGPYEPFHTQILTEILARQRALSGMAPDPAEYSRVVAQLWADPDAYFLGPQGFLQWRGKLSYEDYPYQKIASIETCVRRPA